MAGLDALKHRPLVSSFLHCSGLPLFSLCQLSEASIFLHCHLFASEILKFVQPVFTRWPFHVLCWVKLLQIWHSPSDLLSRSLESSVVWRFITWGRLLLLLLEVADMNSDTVNTDHTGPSLTSHHHHLHCLSTHHSHHQSHAVSRQHQFPWLFQWR